MGKRRGIRVLLRKRGQPPLLPRSWVEEETALMTRRMKKWLPREGQSQEAGQEINLRGGATGPVREGQSRIDPKREGLGEERGQRKGLQGERGHLRKNPEEREGTLLHLPPLRAAAEGLAVGRRWNSTKLIKCPNRVDFKEKRTL